MEKVVTKEVEVLLMEMKVVAALRVMEEVVEQPADLQP